jgi:hypothetical protein
MPSYVIGPSPSRKLNEVEAFAKFQKILNDLYLGLGGERVKPRGVFLSKPP